MKALLAASLALLSCAPAPAARVVDELRPTDPGVDAPGFDRGDVVERSPSPAGDFVVHFTRAGRNAVPADDADRDGVPDFVTLTARTYDAVLAAQRALGFRAPLGDGALGGDARFDVYLVDFAGRADGAFRADDCAGDGAPCAGHMLQENDFAGYGYPSAADAVRTLASHELFHAVQSAYRSGEPVVLQESTAVWATERFDPALPDLERLAARYLDAPDRPLDQDPAGPPDGFSYGVALFFEHVHQARGDGVVRALWERRARRGDDPWLVDLDAALREVHPTTFAQTFRDFAVWNLFTGPIADPTRAYAHGAALAGVRMTTRQLPFVVPSVRLFRASARYSVFTPTAGAQVVLGRADEASDLTGAQGFLACRRGARYDDPRWLEVGSTTALPGDADRCVVALVNTRTTGGSALLSLCAGVDMDLSACAEADAGAPAETDAGTPSLPDAGAAVAPPGGGCAATPARAHASWALLALAALRRRRS